MLFDRHVVVDWSANSTPKRGVDSIWIGICEGSTVTSANHPTRAAAIGHLAALIDDPGARRLLLGIDASLGYPRGTAAALGLEGVPWAETWRLLGERITDDDRNANNRFAVAAELNRQLGSPPGPFWGCPPAAVDRALASTKPTAPGPLPEWRHVEDRLRAAGHRPHSSWQLLGAGSVGSQSLLAISHLDALRRCSGDRLAVWPFTTGLIAPDVGPGEVVVAEVWPSLVMSTARADGRVRDEAQVEDTAMWLAALDRRGELAESFRPDVGVDQVGTVVAEEGWVLGVTGTGEWAGADRRVAHA